MKKMAQIRQILKDLFFQIAKFLWWVPVNSQKHGNILGFFFFQIRLN
jgi:hypothetical protein